MLLFIKKFHKFWPHIIITSGFLIAIFIGCFTYQYYQEKNRIRLELASHKISFLIKSNLLAYEHILEHSLSLFNSSHRVTPDEWEMFFKEQKVYENLKGIQELAYSEIVPPNEKKEYEKRMRKEGFADFKIHPKGDRELYNPIIYLKSFKQRNASTLGYDMFYEKISREAMTEAMQSTEVTISAKTTLSQEFDKNIQAGFLICLPIYKHSSKSGTPQNRTLEIQGFVYASFHASEFMNAIGKTTFPDINFELYDGNASNPENLLYDSNIKLKSALCKKTDIKMNGRTWSLVCKTSSTLKSENIYIIFLIPSLILIVTLLLYLLLQSLVKAKMDALQAGEKLHASEERLLFALEGAGDGFWDWNLKTDEAFYSKRWKEILGYEENDISNNFDEWKSRVHPEDIKQAFVDIQSHIDGESDIYMNEHRLKCKDGSYKWLLSRGLAVSWDIDGNPIRIVGSHNDISERKEMEEELKMYAHDLETKIAIEVEKNRLQQEKVFNQARHAQMGEMIGMIAHQWRQPLNAVSGAAVNLGLKQKFGMLKDEDIEETSEFIQNSAKQMSETIDDFMNFFKSNSEKELFSLTEVVHNIEHLIDAQLKTHGIEMEVIIGDALKIYGNKNELTHILLNLIMNARDALKTKMGTDKKITIHASLESDGLCSIKVIDNGGGIDTAIIDKIFNPYFTTKEQGEGTGIGLHMAKEIIQRSFNGSITVKNTDKGVAFTLYLNASKL